MGFSVPAAIAKVGRPDRMVWAVDGDGCFQMTAQELVTATSERIPIKVAILNNAYLGMVRQWQEMFYDERYSEVYLSPDLPDYKLWAEAMGCVGMRVESPDEVDAAIQKANEIDDRPVVIDFRTDSREKVYPMVPAACPTTRSSPIRPRVREAMMALPGTDAPAPHAGGAGGEQGRRAGLRSGLLPGGVQHLLAGGGAHRGRALQPHHRGGRRRVGLLEQITKQLYKLINVVKISELTRRLVERELMLVTLRPTSPPAARSSSWSTCSRAAVDVGHDELTVSLDGELDRLDDVEGLLRLFGIVELQRTGRVFCPSWSAWPPTCARCRTA